MNGRWKIKNKRKAFSRIEELPTLGLHIRTKGKERSKKRRTRNGRYKMPQQDETDDQPDRIQSQLSRAEVVVVKKISDELRNRKSKTDLKVLDINYDLVRRRRIHLTFEPGAKN